MLVNFLDKLHTCTIHVNEKEGLKAKLLLKFAAIPAELGHLTCDQALFSFCLVSPFLRKRVRVNKSDAKTRPDRRLVRRPSDVFVRF